MNTLGGHAQAVLDLYLRRNGLGADDVGKVEALAVPPVSLEQSLRQGQIDVAALSGIFQDKAIATGGIRQVFRDYDFLGAFTAGSYVFRDDFIERNPDTVRAFTAGVARTIEWTRTTPREEVVARMTRILTARGRNENADALEYWKSSGVAGRGGLMADREFTTWSEWLKDVGQIGEIKAKGLGRWERAETARHHLDLVGLSGFEDRYPHELSGGMKQRVAIARSLAYDPGVLLMDEPFAALDAQTRDSLQDELLRIWAKTGKTVVFITHGIDEAVYLGGRVAVLTSRPGRMKEVVDIDLGARDEQEDLRSSPEFAAHRHRVWSLLKDEVRAAQRVSVPAPRGEAVSRG